jgi:TrmH family RNA methyltransferase
MKITSPDNAQIKYLTRLQTSGSFRKQEKKFLIEGAAAIRSVLENKIHPLTIYICPALCSLSKAFINTIQERNIPVVEISERCFEKISDVQTPQGIAAVFPFFEYDRNTIFSDPNALMICCPGMQDPGNLGAIIRTADAAGLSAVISLAPAVSFFNPKVVRSSAGSLVNIPLLDLSEQEFLTETARYKINLYAAVPREGKSHEKMRFKRPACILIGSEAHGLPDAIRAISAPVSIPMRPGAESLNAAVAAALLMYHAAKKEKA